MKVIHSYKYLAIDINHKLNWNLSVEKTIFVEWNVYYGLKKNCKNMELG